MTVSGIENTNGLFQLYSAIFTPVEDFTHTKVNKGVYATCLQKNAPQVIFG